MRKQYIGPNDIICIDGNIIFSNFESTYERYYIKKFIFEIFENNLICYILTKYDPDIIIKKIMSITDIGKFNNLIHIVHLDNDNITHNKILSYQYNSFEYDKLKKYMTILKTIENNKKCFPFPLSNSQFYENTMKRHIRLYAIVKTFCVIGNFSQTLQISVVC